MTSTILRLVILVQLLLITACDRQTGNQTPIAGDQSSRPSMALIEVYVTEKAFEDVVFELDFAITERNYRITGRNTIGKGIRDRGFENFPDVEVIHFCNLEYAREVLELDPGFVAQMPCRITIHEQNGGSVISLILLPQDHPEPRVNEFSRRMNGILREIVEFVVEAEQ